MGIHTFTRNYVKKKLINLKKELRNLAFKSPLFDSVSFANNFYEMLLDISKKK